MIIKLVKAAQLRLVLVLFHENANDCNVFFFPEFLGLVEKFSAGCETLVSRIIHILTDKVRVAGRRRCVGSKLISAIVIRGCTSLPLVVERI